MKFRVFKTNFGFHKKVHNFKIRFKSFKIKKVCFLYLSVCKIVF
jgi:hypothetical protein